MAKKAYGAVCCMASYPERHAFRLLGEVQAKLAGLTQDDLERGKADQHRRDILRLIEASNNLKDIDKVHQASAKLDDVKLDLNEGMMKLVGNQGSLEDLQSKSNDLKNNAEMFKNNAKDL